MNSATQKSRPRCLQLDASDNVAVVLEDVAPCPLAIVGSSGSNVIAAQEPIARGHKIALCAIAAAAEVRKHGVAIGFATQPIAAGAWVHTHNCRSALDERSHTLDPHSGAPTDTRYV